MKFSDPATWLTAIILAVYLMVVLWFPVIQPIMSVLRQGRYAEAKSVGGAMIAADSAAMARSALERLDYSAGQSFAPTRAIARRLPLSYLLEDSSIRTAKQKVAQLLDDWERQGRRPEEFERAVLALTRAYGKAWQRETNPEAKKLFEELQLTLYREALEVTARIIDASKGDMWAAAAEDRERFWSLYWGDLGTVESRSVEVAMMRFGQVLRMGSESTPPPVPELEAAGIDLKFAVQVEVISLSGRK